MRGCKTLSTVFASASIAMVTARKEDKVQFVYFTDKATQLSLNSESSLNEIVEDISKQIVVSSSTPTAGDGVRVLF